MRRTRRNIEFAADTKDWTERAMGWAKARKIHDVPRPIAPEGKSAMLCGYEEIDGQLYQKWVIE